MEIVVGGEKLYDFLRIKEEDHRRNINHSTSSSSGGGHNHSGLTLSAFLSEKTGHPPPVDVPEPVQPIQSNRTLLDIIREDHTSGLGRGRGDGGRMSWRHLTEKIRLRRRGSDVAVDNSNNRMMTTPTPTRETSIRFDSNLDSSESTQFESSSHRNPSPATERASGGLEQTSSSLRLRLISEDNHRHENEEERSGDTVVAEQPARMSLMALLAENDRQMGYESTTYIVDADEKEAEEKIVSGADVTVNSVEYNNCCVCMVRHKGAAFIPCGHTFCRLCSRELWVQRGHCPLCNNYIVEILDIF